MDRRGPPCRARPLLRLLVVLLLLTLASASESAYDPIEDSPFAKPFKASCNASECDPTAPALLPRGYYVESGNGNKRRFVMLRGQA